MKEAGLFGFSYNRTNYKFDQEQRWSRFTIGRQMEMKRAAMFREDVEDLASVAVSKLKVYVPTLTMILDYCLTTFTEGRMGEHYPAPPTVGSALYNQCLGIAIAFCTLAIWLCLHASMRAQVAMTQLRTRKVRLPVPTQRQLDSARKFLSTYEEQSVYDMLRLPFVMPNAGTSPPVSDEEEKPAKEADKASYAKGGLPGVAAKMKGKMKDLKRATGGAGKEIAHSARMPGTTTGAPSWIQKEFEAREQHPKSSPSSFGTDAPTEPYEHFELMRAAQKEYWCAEAYCRVCFLFGQTHLMLSCGYWLTLHIIGEQAMVWCGMVGATALVAAVWIMFRLDVLPDHGGCLPIEAGGPIILGISLALAYTHDPTPAAIDISRAVGIICILMQMGFTYRMFSIARPSWGRPHHAAKETGGRLFNQSGACDAPSWLPQAFQHVTYLIAPPKTTGQLAKEHEDRDNGSIQDDPLVNVDMTPWYYVRTLLAFVFIGWTILLAGSIVECVHGEGMILSNGGAPPWTRVGQWNGWEYGPVSWKEYAHVTPQKGHFAWQRGWGPQGRQELWPSDVFGFHPEADAHWNENGDVGPEPLEGAAGQGTNTWAIGAIEYGMSGYGYHNVFYPHDFEDNGGHRRLRSVVPGVVRPLVPAALQWPPMFEPEFLACGSTAGQVAALSASGLGTLVPEDVTLGLGAASAASFMLEGLLELGMVRGISWSNSGLLVTMSSGAVALCQEVAASSAKLRCSPMAVPKLPFPTGATPIAAVTESVLGEPVRAAVTASGGRVFLYEIADNSMEHEWRLTDEVFLPLITEGQVETPEIVAVSAKPGNLLVTTADGSTFQWQLQGGKALSTAHREAPSAGPRRSWRAACALPNGKVIRLASNWRRSVGGGGEWHPQLLI